MPQTEIEPDIKSANLEKQNAYTIGFLKSS